MGASVGTGEGKSSNIELNIVPFIDLMSCLVAFLLLPELLMRALFMRGAFTAAGPAISRGIS